MSLVITESIANHSRWLIAQAGESRGRDRWTVLSLVYVPCLDQPWLTQVRGRSIVKGENDVTRRIAFADYESALGVFEDSELSAELIIEADLFLAENPDLIERLETEHHRLTAPQANGAV